MRAEWLFILNAQRVGATGSRGGLASTDRENTRAGYSTDAPPPRSVVLPLLWSGRLSERGFKGTRPSLLGCFVEILWGSGACATG